MHKNIVYILIFLAALALPLHSQEEIGHQPDMDPQEEVIEDSLFDADVITSIEIIGLKRTQLHVAKYPLEKFIGHKKSDFDENEVFAVVKNMSVLEPVSAKLIENEDGIVLRIRVEEKWTIFPFPFVYAGSGGETNFGLFFCDFNAFGLCDMAVFGGAYGSNGWSAIGMYNHTPDRQGVPGISAVFMYTYRENEDADSNEELIRRYFANRLFLSLGFNYNFLEFLNGSVSLYFSDISLKNDDKDDEIFNTPEKDARFAGITPRLSLRNNSWDGYFLSSKSFSLEYGFNYAISGSSYHHVEYRGSFEHSLIPGFRLISRSAGSWKSTSEPLFEDGPQKAGVNILPSNYSALYYAGVSAGLEKYIYKNRWGTLSIQGSWQAVFSYGQSSERQKNEVEFNHGPSGGIVFYLSRLALPAIGSNFAYNMITGLYQSSFSVGMSF